MSVEAKPLEYYGAAFEFPPVSQLEIELVLFRDRAGLGRFIHFQNIVNIIWPKTVWNPWLLRQCESLCTYDRVHWAGCATSGKTYAQGLYAMVWWYCDPERSTVVFTSTTAKMIRRRVWPIVQGLFNSGRLPGNMLDSELMLQVRKGDRKNAITAIAVNDGSTAKAVGQVQGTHNERMLVMVDEAPETRDAAFEATVNLEKGTREWQFVTAGNPVSYFDQHGRACEPKDGWYSVTVDSEEWLTKDGGICLHFDGTKSPALKDPKLHFLYSEKDLQNDLRLRGEKTPSFWKFCRGFWAPDGTTQTVLNEGLIFKHRAMEPRVFVSQVRVVAGVDPSTSAGGDEIVLRFGRVGDLPSGVQGVDLSPFAAEPGGPVLPSVVSIRIDATTVRTDPAEAQIARAVVAECVKRKCSPSDFGCDATGATHGVASRIVEEFGNREIVMVYFGGAASKTPISVTNPKPANETYKDRVTELWFTCREFLIHGQLGGLDPTTIVQFCAREYEELGKPVVIEVESKVKMKSRFGRSPDHADALAVLIAVVKKNVNPGGAVVVHSNIAWEQAAREHDEIWDNGYREDAA